MVKAIGKPTQYKLNCVCQDTSPVKTDYGSSGLAFDHRLEYKWDVLRKVSEWEPAVLTCTWNTRLHMALSICHTAGAALSCGLLWLSIWGQDDTGTRLAWVRLKQLKLRGEATKQADLDTNGPIQGAGRHVRYVTMNVKCLSLKWKH